MIRTYSANKGVTGRRSIAAQVILCVLTIMVGLATSLSPLKPVDANQSLAQWEIDGFSSISGGFARQCGISEGQPYCWGYDTSHTSNSLIPTLLDSNGILAGKSTTAISSGVFHYCLIANNQPYCSGSNSYGQLGNNTTTDSPVPVAVDTTGVLAGKTITAISVGGSRSCVIATGKAYCWGSYSSGQYVNNTSTDSPVPVAVDTNGVLAGKTITAISVGGSHTCVIATGQAYCWGSNSSGQVGNNTSTDSPVPVAVDTTGVLAGKTITSIVAGINNVCAIASGQAYCWGSNSSGQLGNNTSTDSPVPVAVDTNGVLAGKTITLISSSGENNNNSHSCAIASGQAYCWGSNSSGQLGNNTTTDSPVPVAVDTTGVLAGKTVTQLAGGSVSSCVIANTITSCWGKLTGDGTTYRSLTPVLVVSVTAQPTITSVTFTTSNGKKIMNVQGDNLSLLSAETNAGLYRSLVTLDGEPLKFCTTDTFNTEVLIDSQISSERFSETPKCYLYLDNNGFIDTRYLYQIWVPNDFNTNAQGTVQVEGSNVYSYNANGSDGNQGNGDHEDPTYIVNLPPNLMVVANTGTNLEHTGTTSDHSVVQLKTAEGFILAEIPVNTSVDRDWSSVTAGIDPLTKKAFVHGLVTAPGSESSTFTLFVPKAANDNAVIICPGAASLADVRKDCPNAVTYTAANQNVSVVHVEGKQYWKVAGLTGTGGMSVLGAAIGAPNTGFADNAFTDKVNSARFPYVMYSALFVIAAIVFLGSKFMILRKKNNDTKL